MEFFDVIVIGAGPAGLFCASEVAQCGLKVLLLEKNTKPGKKLLISGSGKCNFTNTRSQDTFFQAYGPSFRFVQPALKQFSNKDLRRYFEEQDLPTIEAHDGKVFPSSMKASDIVSLLLHECRDHSVTIRFSEACVSIEYREGQFVCTTSHSEYCSHSLVLSTGGASYPVTGSTGDGYVLAKSLGHTITPIKPALSPVRVSGYDFEHCAGIAIQDCEVQVFRTGKKIGSRIGDVLFTHTGLSGPGIIDFSRSLQVGDELLLNLLPSFKCSQRHELDIHLIEICKYNSKKQVRTVVRELGVADAIVVSILERICLPLDQTCAVLSKNSRNLLTQYLLGCSFKIEEVEGFSIAMATSGGVSLEEVQAKTMESMIVPKLYFAGEILDVDGDTGGYNIQFAFSSAFLAAYSIAREKGRNL